MTAAPLTFEQKIDLVQTLYLSFREGNTKSDILFTYLADVSRRNDKARGKTWEASLGYHSAKGYGDTQDEALDNMIDAMQREMVEKANKLEKKLMSFRNLSAEHRQRLRNAIG